MNHEAAVMMIKNRIEEARRDWRGLSPHKDDVRFCAFSAIGMAQIASALGVLTNDEAKALIDAAYSCVEQ